jgi:hypothetical protein
MNFESRLRKLESRYRATLSAAGAAQAHYMALAGEPSATACAIERANAQWKELESRKRSIVERMDDVERLEQDAMA